MSRGYIISSKLRYFLEDKKSFWSQYEEKYTPNQSDIYKKCENYYIISGDNKLALYLRSHLDQLPHQPLCHHLTINYPMSPINYPMNHYPLSPLAFFLHFCPFSKKGFDTSIYNDKHISN